MKRTAVAAFVVLLAVTGCGDDSGLTQAEREWCTFAGYSPEAAERFDLIFETGLALQLNMDQVNATAAALRAQYEGDGMTPDEAVAQVSQDLFEIEAFVEACRAAYAEHGDQSVGS